MQIDRRTWLASTAASTVAVACGGKLASSAHADKEHGEHEEHEDDEVTPAEDLMREHGVLRRVMYLYDEAAGRLEAKRDVPLDAVAAGAAMIRRVIEDYHEKLEENLLFPRFEKAGKLADLTATLRRQHVTGRTLTDQITALAKGALGDHERAQLADTLRHFDHMYRAHAAREDTVLFPEIRKLVGKQAYAELGEQFEDQERKMLGEGGFEHAVVEVGKLEQAFGLDFAAL